MRAAQYLINTTQKGDAREIQYAKEEVRLLLEDDPTMASHVKENIIWGFAKQMHALCDQYDHHANTIYYN